MKRKISILTAIAVLVGASAAYAALNTYQANLSFSPSRAGTTKNPSPLAFTTGVSLANSISGDRVAPVTNMNYKIYGLRINSAGFPTCSFSTIDTGPRYNAACPRGSEIATGSVSSEIGNSVLSTPGSPCTLGVHILNAGGGKIFTFNTATPTSCGGLTTGATAPTPAYISRVGKYLQLSFPIPRQLSTAVAFHTGLFGSLIKETLNWKLLTHRAHGKTTAFFSSVACAGGRRPWSVSFSATDLKSRETKTVSGSARC